MRDVRAELILSEEDEEVIALEKDLIKTLVRIREEQRFSQAQVSRYVRAIFTRGNRGNEKKNIVIIGSGIVCFPLCVWWERKYKRK